MKTEEFTIDYVSDQLGLTWKDPDIVEKVKKSGFGNLEYFDRKHFFRLKVNEIKDQYPEYISNAPKNVLDVSSGNGIQLEIMRMLGHTVTGLDTPNSLLSPLARSQDILIVKHNCDMLPLPFLSQSIDLLTNVGALHFYNLPWDKIIKEFMRVSRETIFVSVSKGDIFDKNKHILDDYQQKGWKRVPLPKEYMFKWVKY
jgi:ubiquinone/menaquinone biosynthesis C-methylase UbiE